MPRKNRPLERDTGVVRDANLIVIASEDQDAVKKYFAKFRTRRVQFRVLETTDGKGSPAAVLARLDEYQQEYSIGEDDQLWYCGDVDHWAKPDHIQVFLDVLKQCFDKGYEVAISNPCFEFWLLLHFSDHPVEEGLKCPAIGRLLSQAAGGYSKNVGCRSSITAEMVHTAAARAKALDTNDHLIPDSYVTRVYLIIDALLSKQMIELG
ncbi:MAG: RloB family protein [Planctomycetota bacterium]